METRTREDKTRQDTKKEMHRQMDNEVFTMTCTFKTFKRKGNGKE